MSERYERPTFDKDKLFTFDGVKITEGLRVWDHNLDSGAVTFAGVRTDSGYWDGWFHVALDKGGRSYMNAERVRTRHHTDGRKPPTTEHATEGKK